MIPFGLSSLMTVSLPIGRRSTKCLIPGATAVYLCNEGSGTTLTDRSGNGYHGAFAADAAAPTWTQYGISLDGGDFATCGTAPDASPTGMTVQVLCYATTDANQGIVCKASDSTASGADGFFLAKDATADTWWFNVYNAARAKQSLSMANVATGAWHVITGVVDAANVMALYANQTRMASRECVGISPATLQQLTLGRLSYTNTWRLTGGIAAVLLYPFCLTEAQIAWNYGALRALVAPRPIALPDDRLGGTVMFRFDDGYASVYDLAYPVLSAAGMTATCYVNSATIGTANYMTEEQIIELYGAGWDIANHTATHANLTTLTEAQQETELATCAAYLDGLGLTRASHHVAYPWGQSNADTATAMTATGMLTGIKTGSGLQTTPIADLKNINGVTDLTSTTTLAAATAKVDPLGGKRIVTYMGHKIATSAAAITWATDDFKALVDHVGSRDCRAVTISQLYNYVQAGYVWPG